MPNLDTLDTLDVLDKVDPDGLLDLSGSVAEKVQNQARFPKKEQLTRMKREFCPVRGMIWFLRRSFTASSGVSRRFVV